MNKSLNLNHLRVFHEVVLSGSFSKAAQSLLVPKSKVSRQISSLEKELKTNLIYRTTRQFRLTPAGENLFAVTKKLLVELGQVVGQFDVDHATVTGTIRVSVPDDIGMELMGDICAEFQKIYPEVRFFLELSNRRVDLVKEAFDLAIRAGTLRDSTMIRTKIGKVRFASVVSPILYGKIGEIKNPLDLSSVPTLGFVNPEGNLIKLTAIRGKEKETFKFEPVFTTNNFFLLRKMALKGVGVAFLPEYLIVDKIKSGELRQVLGDWVVNEIEFSILMPSQKEVPIRIKKFVQFIKEYLWNISVISAPS